MIALLAYLCGARAFSQTYPSGLVTVFTNPRSLFLDEYADPFVPRIRTTIYFTDFTESQWQFCLRLKISGPDGIIITSKPGARPAVPVIVSPGNPYSMEGADLAFYFNYNNLDFLNISRSRLEQNHRLPEGHYTFCFEAIDYESGRALSHPACASAYLSLSDPPLITSPVCGSVIENISLQNILFQWQRGNANGNSVSADLRYTVQLYEVNNSWVNPYTAITNNQALPIWESQPLTATSLFYSNSEPPLETGKRYVFTVKAWEENGRSRFKNDGYSMPCYFHYGYYENDTIPLISPAENFQFTLGTASRFVWRRPPKALRHQMISYTLKLVAVDSLQDPEDAISDNLPFFQQTYLANNNQVMEKTIPVAIWANIRRMGKYAWQVSARSGNQDVAISRVQTFTGPPEIENFIAGGFLMQVTKLSSYDRVLGKISGRCKTTLNNQWTDQQREFDFNNILISPIGNNEWVMTGGAIVSALSAPDYTLTPRTHTFNGKAYFSPDSVFVNTSGLRLSGHISWHLPHPGSAGDLQIMRSARCRLRLANLSFWLNNDQQVNIAGDQKYTLAEPAGFGIRLNASSSIQVSESKYELYLNGYLGLPENVKDGAFRNCLMAFSSQQLHYISETENEGSSDLSVAPNTGILLQPRRYVIDLDESRSPGEFSADSTWKGLYIEHALLHFPAKTESSGQLSLPLARTFTFSNTVQDSSQAYINHRGMYLKTAIGFGRSDSLKFNGFTSREARFYLHAEAGEVIRSEIEGAVFIPVIDTLRAFPYRVELGLNGFNEGYLVNGLQGTTFTFNPAGSAQERIIISIRRALFAGRNRLELDMDLNWPFFALNLSSVEKFCVWGNGNIGFTIPNGKISLATQASGKAGNFDITVDNIGCGRSGNAYAFGASAKINMDEEISGETGPPVMNAYSIYKNPLLTGMVIIPASQTLASLPSGTNQSGPVYQSATSQHTASAITGLSETLGTLGFSAQDTITGGQDEEKTEPLVSGNLIAKIQTVLDLVYKLKPFIPPGNISEKDWMVLDRLRAALTADIIKSSEITNARALVDFILRKAVDGIIERINKPVSDLSAMAVTKVRSAVNGYVVNPINNTVDRSLSGVFLRLEQNMLAYADEQYHEAIHATLQTVRSNITIEVTSSVASAFEQNITQKIGRFVELGLAARIRGFVRKEVTFAGNELITKGAGADIKLSKIVNNAGELFRDLGDTIRDVILKINGAMFINTAESIAEDMIAGIDWGAVSTRILNELVTKGISEITARQLSLRFQEQAGPYIAAALNTVKFDFSNLGEKLQNGEFNKVVKFDPTTIYISSPTCDIRGSLKFVKDDPVFGDSWQSDVFVRVKTPKKDNPVECSAFFLNGKTTQQAQNFTYWFVKLGVMGLDVPMEPTPLVWDGVEGFAFSKMKKSGEQSVIPDNTNKFGVGARFYFRDDESKGQVIIFSLGAEAAFNDGGYAVQLVGDASVMNYLKVSGKYRSPGFMTGTGSIGYFKTPECRKIAGNFNVKLNTEPLLCASGDLGFDLRTPANWRVWIGTQQQPVGMRILCKDFLSNTAYIEVANNGFRAGLNMKVSINAQSPWIELTAIKVRGYAALDFGYQAQTTVSWDPDFVINEAGIMAWASASIGIEYESAGVTNNLTLAGVNLSGSLLYKSKPESELHGAMSGAIKVLGYDLTFNTPVHYSLSQRQIIN